MEIKVKKPKITRGLPKRTGKRGNGRARHGSSLGVKRKRTKAPGFRGVAVPSAGSHILITHRR